MDETHLEEADCPSLFLALACGVEATKPCLLRVGPADLLEEEANSFPIFEAYGPWSPKLKEAKVIATRHKHSIMVIPLAGGQCLLPPLAAEPALEQITCFTKSFTDALSANDGNEVPVAVSRALKATQHVCCSILLQPMLNASEEVLNLNQVFSNLEDLMLGGN